MLFDKLKPMYEIETRLWQICDDKKLPLECSQAVKIINNEEDGVMKA